MPEQASQDKFGCLSDVFYVFSLINLDNINFQIPYGYATVGFTHNDMWYQTSNEWKLPLNLYAIVGHLMITWSMIKTLKEESIELYVSFSSHV